MEMGRNEDDFSMDASYSKSDWLVTVCMRALLELEFIREYEDVL